MVLGFAINDFNQDTKEAKICFVNYEFTFDWFDPIKASIESTYLLFKALALQSKESVWSSINIY